MRLKIKAGALQLTLFIGIVVALILTAFILLVHTHKRFQVNSDFAVETIRNADRGISFSLFNSIPLRDTLTIDLNSENYKSLKVYRDYWGVFEKVSVTSKIKNHSFEKIALVGGFYKENQRPALVLKDNQKPLVVVGQTQIKGLVLLPKQGIKSGIIAGNSYYGSQLIYGKTRTSVGFPELNRELLSELSEIENVSNQFKNEDFMDLQYGSTINNSFFDQTKVIFSNQDILLTDIRLTGNIIVQSKSKVTIDRFADLQNVILIAPKIEILDNVIGSFQSIASEHITVGQNVILDYPSALVLKKQSELQNQDVVGNSNEPIASINIGSDSDISGGVIYIGTERTNNYQVQLTIEENAAITGEVYCNQNIELKGTVIGSVYADNFIANQSGSIYQNHIYNGRIDETTLDTNFSGVILGNSTSKNVMTWLY